MVILNKQALVSLIFYIVFGCVFIYPVVAENETSTLSGRVIDAEGEPLNEVPIELASVEIRKEKGGAEDLPISLKTQTDSKGRFTFTNIAQGLVQLRVHNVSSEKDLGF